MMPLTNSQIEAAKTAEQKQAERGTRAEVQTAVSLLGGRQLVGHLTGSAEIRDAAGAVVYRGTWDECMARAESKGWQTRQAPSVTA